MNIDQSYFLKNVLVTNGGFFSFNEKFYKAKTPHFRNRSVLVAGIPGDNKVIVAYGSTAEECSPSSGSDLFVTRKKDKKVILDTAAYLIMSRNKYYRWTRPIRALYKTWLPRARRLAKSMMSLYRNQLALSVSKEFINRNGKLGGTDLNDLMVGSGAVSLFTRTLQSFHTEVYAAGGRAAARIVRMARRSKLRKAEDDDVIFNVWNEDYQKWIDTQTAILVTGINEQTVKAIREIINEGMDLGQPINRIARRIKQTVGLNWQQAKWVASYEKKLIEAAKKGLINPNKIDKMVAKYANRMHNLRATTIARTETMRALNFGTIQGYKQNFVTRVIWVTSPGACPECEPLEGQVFNIDEVPEIPLHISGRCCIAPDPESIVYPKEMFIS